MIKEFEPVVQELAALLDEWEPRLAALQDEVISQRRNSQHRTIKQIAGHMVDSASNNTHRIIHLQYRESPLTFPNYASEGNNDRWIAIQNYQDENWSDLIQLWKFCNIHLIHVIRNVKTEKLNNEWISGSSYGNITLKVMVIEYLKHFRLHLDEIEELMGRKNPAR